MAMANLSRLNKRRDLVLVDQRGTGRSAPLKCAEMEKDRRLLADGEDVKLALACAKQLQTLPYGDLRMFSTSIAAKDLEAVRVAQGYEKSI